MKHLVFFLFCFLTFQLSASEYEQEVLIFYHIPKCGGTTIASLVGQKFSTSETYHHRVRKNHLEPNDPLSFVNKNIRQLRLEELDIPKIRYIHGHIAYSPHFRLPGAKNFTFLRNPVERIFSAYRYVKQAGKKVEFFDFYRKISNVQVVLLSDFSRDDPTVSLQDHLESAKRNLAEKFFFVGIVEEMEASMKTLYTLQNWELLSSVPTFNITKKGHHHNSDLYDFVYREEWADRELYEFGKQLFQEQLKEAERRSRSYTPLPSQTSQVHFTPEDPLDGEGWGYKEIDLETNTRLRQTYSKTASISFPLLHLDYKMTVKAAFPTERIQKGFQILVNGSEVPYMLTAGGKWKTYQLFIPRSLLTKHKTTFTFCVSELYVPFEHERIPDYRKMGVSVAEIRLDPQTQ